MKERPRMLRDGQSQYQEFAKLRRKIRVMLRQDIDPPREMLERLVELDGWLSNNYRGWVSNFPQAHGSSRRGNK